MGTHSVSLVRRFMVISLLLALVLGAAGAIPALAAMIMTAATVDNSASDVGQYSSMVLSSSGNPIISYYDVTNDDLKLVFCGDVTCTSKMIATVDSAGGANSALALDSNGNPVLSYRSSGGQLKLAVCNNNTTCNSPTFTIVDTVDTYYTSLALTASNYPVISYFNASLTNLKLALCTNPTCTAKTITTVDGTQWAGYKTAVKLNSSGYPIISYYVGGTVHGLRVAICNNSTTCNAPTLATMPDNTTNTVGDFSSLTLNGSGYPVVSYYDQTAGDLKVAVCNDATTCGAPTVTNVDSTGDVGQWTSVKLNSSGYPVISYYDVTNGDLKLAQCTNATCTTKTLTTVDSTGSVGQYTSLALTANGLPFVSYYDVTNGNLKLAVGADAPLVTTNAATSIAGSDATLNGTVNANNASTAVTFEYGPTTSYGTTVTAAQSPVTGNSNTAVSKALSNLTPSTTYHYRVVGVNANGTTTGSDQTFNTLSFCAFGPPATFVNRTTANGLGGNIAIGVYVSGTTVYVGTYTGGLSISTDGGNSFTTKTTANGLGSNAVYGVYVVGSTVYAATSGGLSISTDGGSTFTNKTTANGLGNNWGRGVYVSGSTIYAATDGGLAISTNGGSTFTNRTTANGLGNNLVYAAYASGSMVYAATGGGGLSISTDGGTSFTTKTTANGLGNNDVRAVYASGSTVYAGTNGGGLSISTDGGNSFTSRTTANGLGNNVVFGVYVNGTTVYAATSGGLSISMDGGSTFTNRTTANGLGDNVIYGIYASGTTAYAVTFNGLSYGSCGVPTVTTNAATSVTTNGATLNGTVNASGVGTTVTFQYGLTTGYGSTVTATQSPVTGNTNTAVSAALASLTPNTTYHYRVVGVNSVATANGSDQTFATACLASAIVTNNADSGLGSLRQAIADTCAGGTITFDNDYIIHLASTLTINKNLTINGAGHTVSLDGQNSILVLAVNSGVNFALQNLTITQGNTGDYAVSGLDNAGTTTVTNVAFLNNHGRAIVNSSGDLTVVNSTIAGSTDMGIGNWATLRVLNSTIANNSGTGLVSGSGNPSVDNTIIAGNAGGNCASWLPTGANNLADDASCGGAFTNSASILLGTLGNYGGSTQNFPLLMGSSAINAGNDALCPSTDQRGVSRPIGTHCDIGAYEQELPTVTTSAASSVTVDTATLNGSVNAHYGSTPVTFEYGLTTGYGTTVTADQSPATGNSNTAVSKALTGLVANTTYHYRVAATNPAGAVYGSDQTFVTPCRPAVIVANANDSGAGSLRQAIADVCVGGPITFNGDYVITLASTLTIDKHLTIDGAGHTITLSGNDAVRVFYVNSGVTFNLQNLAVVNGYAGTANGGGIYNNFGTVNISNSTFTGNHVSVYWGGAIYSVGTVNISNSTFANNSAGTGGALFADNSTMTVLNSTFSGNSAGTTGGIFNRSSSVTVNNSIVANNPSGGNCGGTISGANNLADDATCGAGATNSATILLGSLGNNGGNTLTFALQPGSSAINAGNDALCPSTDQRGFPRPIGSHCDIGSYEDVGLLGYWPLDDSGTTIADASGRGHGGTLTGGSWSPSHAATTDLPNSGALSLTGVNGQGVTMTRVTTATNNLSLAAWVNWAGLNGTGQLVMYNGSSTLNGYGVYLMPDGTLSILNGNVGYAASTATLTPSVWQNIIAVRDSGVWKLYVDGTPVALTGNPVPNTPTGYAAIGRAPTVAASAFNGLIDEVKMYDRALPATEVARLAEVVAITPNSVDFGSQDIAAGPTASQIISITNDGSATVNLASVSLIGTDASLFSIVTDSGETTLGAGATRSVSLAFAPSTIGAKTATLHIVSSNTTYDVSLIGTGTGYSELTVTPAGLSFGSQSISAGATASQIVTVTNTGSLPLTGISVSLTGTDVGQYAITSDTAETTLAPNAVRTVRVAFDPSTVGAKSANLHIVTASGTRDVALSGTGTGYSEITVTPTTLSFGSQSVSAGATANKTVYITSTGNLDLTGINVSLTGTNPGEFVKSSDTGQATLTPGAVRIVNVAFDPSTIYTKSATLRIVSNVGTRDVALSGIGTGYSQLTVSPLSLSFGSQQLKAGQTAAQTISITNTGNITLTVTGVTLTGTNAGEFVKTSDTGQTTLGPGVKRTVQIAFDPSTLGAKTAAVHIVTDNGTQDVALSGTGAGTSQLSVSPTSLNLGSRLITAGATAAQQVNISNSGDADLTVTSVTLTGVNASEFAKSSDTNQTTLTPGATRTVKITFDPSTVGAKTAALHIVTNNGTQDVALSGTGLGISELVISTSSLAFGTQRISAGQTYAYSVDIRNTGTASLNVTSVTLTGSNPGEFVKTSDTNQATLAPNATRTVKIAFDPSSVGAKTANLTIVTDNGTRDVALTGTGTGGLMSYLNFDEAVNATSFADASNNGHGGTCSTCPTAGTMAGFTGSSLRFEGGETVSIANHADLNSTRFSVSAWIFPTGFNAAGTPQTVIAKQAYGGGNRTYNLTIYPNPLAEDEAGVTFSFTANNCSTLRTYNSVDTIMLNEWSQVVVTYDGAYFKLYINGQLDSSKYVTDGVCTNSSAVSIGNGTGGYQGMIDEVRLYDYAIAASDVSTLNADSPIPMLCSKDTLEVIKYDAPIPFSDDFRTEALIQILSPSLSNVSSDGCNISGKLRIFTYGNNLLDIPVTGSVDKSNHFVSSSIGGFAFNLAGFGLEVKKDTAKLTTEDGNTRLTIYGGYLKAPKSLGGAGITLLKPVKIDAEDGFVVDGTIGLPEVTFGAFDALGAAMEALELELPDLSGGFLVQNGRLIIKAHGKLQLPNITAPMAKDGCGIEANIEFYVDLTGTAQMRIETLPVKRTIEPNMSVGPNAAVVPVGLSDLSLGMSCAPGIPIPVTGPAVAATPIWLVGIRGTVALSQEDIHLGAGVTLATSSYKLGPLTALTVDGDMVAGIKPMTATPSKPIPEAYIEVSGAVTILDIWKAVAAKVGINSRTGFTAVGDFVAGILHANVTLHLWSSPAGALPMDQVVNMTGSGTVNVGVKKGEFAELSSVPYPCNCKWVYPWWGVPYYWCYNVCTDGLSVPPWTFNLGSVSTEFGSFRRGTEKTIGFKGYTDSTLNELRAHMYIPEWAKFFFDALHIGFFVDAQTQSVTFTDWNKYQLLTASAARQAKQLNSLSTVRPLTAAEQALVHDYRFVDDKTLLLNASNAVSQGKANSRAVSPNDAITRTQVFATTDTLFNITSDQPFEMSLITPDGQEITPLNYDQAPISPTLQIGYSTVTTYTLPRDEDHAPRWRLINASIDTNLLTTTAQLDGVLVVNNPGLPGVLYVSPYIDTISGTHTLGLVLPGQTDPAVTFPFAVEDNQGYSVVVLGSNLANSLILPDDNTMPTTFNTARLRLINGAEHIAPTLDVAVDGTAWVNGSVFKAVSDYRELAAGSHTVEVRNATDQTLLSSQLVTVTEGSVYTLLVSDWLSGTEYASSTALALDEQYHITTITQYAVAQAPIGEWQVKLVGDTDTARWTMGVLGQPNSPMMTNVTLDASQLNAAQVALNVKAEYQPITLTYKLKSDDLTSEMVFTDTDGAPITATVPQLNGVTLAEVTITDPNQLNGTQPIVQALDLTGLASDNYYIIIVAEDGVTPAVEAFARPPAGYSVTGKPVASRAPLPLAAQTSRVSNPMDLLLGVEPLTIDNTATFPGHFASTPITLTPNVDVYVPNISGTQMLAGHAPLYIQWSLSNNPDTDDYVIYIDTQPFPADDVLTTTQVITGGHFINAPTGGHIWPDAMPGQTYYVAVGAIDYASGQIDRSALVSIAVTSGDFGLLNPIAPVQLIDQLVATVDYTQTIDLFYGLNSVPDMADVPSGLSAQSGDALTDKLPITLTASSDVAPGLYDLPIVAYSGELSRTTTLQVQVERPELVITKALLTPSAKTGETVTYRIAFTNTGTVDARGVLITDTVFANMTGLTWNGSANVHSTDGQVWTVDDLAPNATGYINVSGVLPASSAAGVLPSDVEITTATPEYVRGNNAATVYLALDGQPLVSNIGPFEIGEPAPLGEGVCGSVTFISADELPATLTITYTERQPSVSQTGLQRQYRLEPEGGSNYLAQLTLCYDDAELALARVTDEATLHAYRYEGSGVWQQYSTVDALNNTVTADGLTQFGVWGLAITDESPTAIVVSRLAAQSAGTGSLLIWLALSVIGLGAIIGWRRTRR